MLAAPPIRPFPWRALASTTRAEAAAWSTLRRSAEGMVHPSEFAAASSALLGARVEVMLRRVASGPWSSDGVGVLFAVAGSPSDAFLVEAEPALATAMVARALRRKAPQLVASSREAPEALAGGFAAILHAAARRAHAGAALSVLGAGSSAALAARLAHPGVSASFTVLVDDDAYLARVAVTRLHALEGASAFSRSKLAALGDLPLAIPIVAAASAATGADVASLRPGDAWIPGAWPLTKRGRFAGPVWLAAPGSDAGVRAMLGEDGRLVLVDSSVGQPSQDERGANEAMSQAIGDVPVTVRVEIGAVEMRAREWAALGQGDVVALGVKIADAVVLRVGGVEVARGELVEIDGEVGVRILSRTAGA